MAGMTYVMVFEDIGPGHPAVQKIAKVAKVDPLLAFGALVYFWQWADKLTDDGFIPDVDEAIVDYQVRLPGFAKALSEYGKGDKWLRFDESGLHIHNYNARGGTSTKQRYKKRNQKQIERAAGDIPATPVADLGDIPATNDDNPSPDEATCSFDRESKKEITSSSSPKTAPKEAEEAAALRVEGGEWHAVFVDLCNEGVGAAGVAVSSAKQSGWLPALARDVIAYFRRHKKRLGGPPALYKRFTERGPEFAPNKGWLKPDAEAPPPTARDPAVQREMDIRAVMQKRGVSKAEAVEIVDSQALTA